MAHIALNTLNKLNTINTHSMLCTYYNVMVGLQGIFSQKFKLDENPITPLSLGVSFSLLPLRTK